VSGVEVGAYVGERAGVDAIIGVTSKPALMVLWGSLGVQAEKTNDIITMSRYVILTLFILA